jgi:hypothetical protein
LPIQPLPLDDAATSRESRDHSSSYKLATLRGIISPMMSLILRIMEYHGEVAHKVSAPPHAMRGNRISSRKQQTYGRSRESDRSLKSVTLVSERKIE